MEWSPEKRISEYLVDSGFIIEGFSIVVDGKVETDHSKTIAAHSQILIIPVVRFAGIGLATIMQAIIIGFMVFSVIYSIATANKKQKLPTFGTDGEGLDANSPTYGWDGIQTTDNVGTPVPVVYGEHKVGGNIINQYINSDGDKNYLNVLLALCEGEIHEIDTDTLKLNDNLAANFDGIELTTKLGTNAQAPISAFEDLHDLENVSVELNDASDDHTVTTTDSDVEALEVHLQFSSGLYSQDATSGNIGSASVAFTLQYKVHSSGTWHDFDGSPITITESNRSAVRRIFRKEGLTAGQYDVKIVRSTAQGDQYTVNGMTWTYLDAIKTDNLAYPNTALLGIKALATEQLSGSTPNITVTIKGKKVRIPNVLTALGGTAVPWEDYYYDPDDDTFKLFSNDSALYWDETTFIDAYSANPAWCLRDLLTNTRYGIGDFVETADIDDDMILETAKYCDEAIFDGSGGYEKRFRMDVVIDSQTRALDALMQLAVIFRGILYFSEGTIKIRCDRPENPVQLFGMGNIVKGSFQESFKSIKDIANVIEVQYMDKDKDYQQEVVSYIDEAALTAGEVLRKKELRVFCTRTSQAIREARYFLNAGKYLNRQLSFKVGIDAVAVQVGDVISVAHDVPQWGFSGRVSAVVNNYTVTLDQEVIIAGEQTYEISVRHSDDTIEKRTVNNSAGTTSVITVASIFGFVPAVGDVYSFGVQNILVKPFRVLNVMREEGSQVSITAIEYNASIYDDTAPVIPTSNYSVLDSSISSIDDLNLTQGSVVQADGSVVTNIDVWFSKPSDSTKSVDYRYANAKVYLSDNAQASWTLVGMTAGTTFQIPNVQIGKTYYVAVASVVANGQEQGFSDAEKLSISMVAPTTGISSVSGFSYALAENIVRLMWLPNPELDLAGYEIRDQNSNFGTADSHMIMRGMQTEISFEVTSRTVPTYYIRAFNRMGVYSPTSVSVTPSNAAPGAITGLGHDLLFNVARLYWTNSSDADIQKYQVYKSDTNAWGGEETLLGEVKGIQIDVVSKSPRSTVLTGVTSRTVITCASLIGMADDYYNGDQIRFISGNNIGVFTISDFNGTTGEITLSSAAGADFTVGDTCIINDIVYLKVRGVDKLGVGTFSSSHQIIFESLTEDMLGDQTISARKINVGCLSAISANMGFLTAGVIQGGTYQTGSGGERLVLNSTGLYGYDSSCCERLRICNDGSIVAMSARFQDPACNCCYSYINSGALKFHDECGDVPYVKRICSGTIATGGVVCLPGWKTSPDVMVGIKTLYSYDSTYNNQCQAWDVYACDPVCYNSGGCYGYCFEVHAILRLSSGAGNECAKNAAFDACACTQACVCSTSVKTTMLYYCNAVAPGNYYYGIVCFALCYRVLGSGTWCACCYTYTQPHTSTTAITTACAYSVTINFPCLATWEVMAHEVSTCWTDSGFASGSMVCCCACCSVSCFAFSCCQYSYCHQGTFTRTIGGISFGSSPVPAGGTIFCSCVAFSTCCMCMTWNGGDGRDTDYLELSYAKCSTYFLCGCSQRLNGNTGCYCNCFILSGCYFSFNLPCCFDACLCFNQYASWYIPDSAAITKFYAGCFTGICQVICYCYATGSSACCKACCVSSFLDTFGCYCVLDPNGQLNWLAIAYT